MAPDNPLFSPPFVGTRVAVGIPFDEFAEYIKLTALFRIQWGFRPVNGENDSVFKDRVKATLRESSWARPRRPTCTGQRSVAYGHSAPPTPRATTSSSGRTRAGPRSGCASPSQASAREPWLCISDFFRPADSGDEDFASFMLCTIGARHRRETARLFAENQHQEYLLPCTASVSRWPRPRPSTGNRRACEEPRVRGRGRPDADRGFFRQQYRGGRYSWGYPACPDLTDNAKVVELLGGDRIGVTVSEGFQLNPEQTTDAIICHHPEAKYFVA